MEEKRVAEYFVVAGLPEENRKPLDGFSDDSCLKTTYKQDPIVDLVVINKTAGETPPARFRVVETTPTGFPADLNHGTIRYPELYLCFRRGRDKPPITDIGVIYEGKEKISSGCDAIYQTPFGRSANVNNSTKEHIYLTYRRAMENADCHTLAVMDVCVILANKGEVPPHAFLAVGKSLNKAMMGSTIYLCYKKSMAKTDFLAYKPAILGRYPLDDHADFPLVHDLPMFCLPLGATIEAWPAQAQHPMPKFSTFVLTQEHGGKVYGAAVTFYEDFDGSSLTHQQQQQLGLITSPSRKDKQKKTLHHTKCICLLSRWPFFSTFRTFLFYLYRISVSGAHAVPIERYITHFMTEVPFPSPQRPRVQVELNFNTISLFLPEESPLPQSGASYTTLVKHLGPENCLNVLLYTLMEHKILIHSLCPAVLTSAAEAIANMIFPFHWHCPYIPLCPLNLSEYLSAPTPFIVGIDSRYFDLFDPPPDVTCVDLDTNTVRVAEDKKNSSSSYKSMPKRLVKQLRTTLERLHQRCCTESYEGGVEVDFETFPVDQDVIRRRKMLQLETSIQEAFLRFMALLLKGYNNHLLPITQQPNQMTTDFSARFDVHAFIKSRDKAYHKFYHQLKDTQNFTSFIQERSFVSDKDDSLAFFDECIEKVEEGRDEPKLIELEDSSNSERTVVITPPEPAPDGKMFNYTVFPKLNPTLFPSKPKSAQLNVSKHNTPAPSSPMTKRTKQEIKIAQKAARKFAGAPDMWAKCLLWHCYSLWFIHLPGYVKSYHSKAKALRYAYDVLGRMQSQKIHDEVCYRVLMQLCGQYHQPILAVRVFSDMRRRGIDPNAITYGFYNKAVLESKWPSSDTAYLRWNKLRNAILVVAQFRRNLKIRRRQSMCSMSESDLDRISRASFDSYLDEGASDKTDASKPHTEIVGDLVAVEGSGTEEKTSTGISQGGMSDRGYSSMTLDDAKLISIVIGSQDSIDSVHKSKTANNKHQEASKLPNGRVSKGASSPSHQKVARNDSPNANEDTNLAEKNGATSTRQFLSKPSTSIVRKSVSSGGGDLCSEGMQNSLMMTNESSLDDSVFSSPLSVPIGSNLSDPLSNHSTAQSTERPVSLLTEGAPTQLDPCKVSSNDSGIAQSDNIGSSSSCDGKQITEERAVADSSLNVDTTDPFSTIEEQLPSPLLSCKSVVEAATNESSEITPCNTPMGAETNSRTTDNDSNLSSKTILNADDSLSEVSKLNDSDLMQDPLVSIMDSPSKSASPLHSIRTPVTENDPLGLFTIPMLSAVASAPALAQLERGAGDSGENKGSTQDLLIDLQQPFGGTSTPVHARWRGGAGDAGLGSSTPSSPGSAAETWSPLSTQTQPSPTRGPMNTPRKANTLPNTSHGSTPNFQSLHTRDAEQGSLSKTSTPNRYGKTPSRSESFSNAFRSVTSRMANKFTEFKQSMATPTKDDMGSSASLNRNDLDKVISVEDRESSIRKAGSLDFLGEEPRLTGSSRDPRSSLEDIQNNKTGKPYMSNIFNKASNMWGISHLVPHSAKLHGWASKFGSMKESLKTSLKESFSLGEDFTDSEDEDYYYRESDVRGLYNTREEDGSIHDYSGLDKVSINHLILESRDEVDKSPLDHSSLRGAVGVGSLQNLPQSAMFNIAVEVEICSLSRCQTCQTLLYDEEIMSGWTPDDSNLNTTCSFCAYKFVPSLHVFVKDYRHCCQPNHLSASQSIESMLSIQSSNAASRGIPTTCRPTGAHRSMTSLSSAENVISGSADSRSIDTQSVVSGDVPTDNLTSNESKEGFMNDSSPNISARTSVSVTINSSNTTRVQNNQHEMNSIGDLDNNLIHLSPLSSPSRHPLEVVEEITQSTEEIDNKPLSDSNVKLPPDDTTEHSLGGGTEESQQGSTAESNGKDNIMETTDTVDSDSMGDQKDSDSTSDQPDMGEEGVQRCCVTTEPISVPYLSPLVLRKELENVLEQEGDSCLSSSDFVDEHPILYWNLVWYFKRLEVSSHIPGFILSARSLNKQPAPKAWASADSRHVSVRSVWDNLLMHQELGSPLYVLWKKAVLQPSSTECISDSEIFTKSMLMQILSSIREDDLLTPIQMIMSERIKMRAQGATRFHSMYRDLLYLTLVAFSKDSVIDLDLFDQEYRSALQSLSQKEATRTHACDIPPTLKTVFCRKNFMPLEL